MKYTNSEPRRRQLRRIVSFLILASLISYQYCEAEEAPVGVSDAKQNVEVKLPEHIFYNGFDKTMTAVLFGGVIGGVVAESVDATSDKIKEYLRRENIDIAEIVSREFNLALKARPGFLEKFQKIGPTRFKLEVYNYGLARNGGFSNEFKTLIGIRAKLISQNGEVIWEEKGNTRSSDGELKANSFKAYFDSREPFAEGFRKSSEIAIQRMFKDL
jgi:hypothetical protein